MIIDALTHITPTGQWFGTRHDASLARLSAVMAQQKIDKVVVTGLPGQNFEECILQASRDNPGRIAAVAAFEMQPQDNLREYLAGFKKRGFVGIKIHPRRLKASLEDPLWQEVFELCGDLGLVVFLCTIVRSPAILPQRPLAYVIADLCRNNPRTKIVLVHGGYDLLLSVSEQIRPFENVLLDLSMTLTRFQHTSLSLDIQFLVNNFERRLCVGSDFPEYSFQDVLVAFSRLGFDGDCLVEKGILGKNLAPFLGG